jgi:ABC-type bacteriocin/lantibiotic exporter with double-glycine peptidase domain
MSDMRQAKIEPQINVPQPEAAERHDSGIRALAAVARHYQLDWSLQRLTHKYVKEREPGAKELVRIARAEGLKASAERTNWKYLARLQKLTPFLVRLDTGGFFVVLKVGHLLAILISPGAIRPFFFGPGDAWGGELTAARPPSPGLP